MLQKHFTLSYFLQKWFCSNCHESGHLQERCPKPRDYLKRICRNCGEVGHLLSACPHAICFVSSHLAYQNTET